MVTPNMLPHPIVTDLYLALGLLNALAESIGLVDVSCGNRATKIICQTRIVVDNVNQDICKEVAVFTHFRERCNPATLRWNLF